MKDSLHYDSNTHNVMANISNVAIIVPVIILILVQITNVSTTSESDGTIISWKGVEGLSEDRTLSPNVTDECIRNKFCGRVSNYPTKIARWALEQLQEKGVTGLVERAHQSPNNIDILYTACNISEEIIYPRAAESSNNKWFFILNLERKLYQGFYTNRCSSDETPVVQQMLSRRAKSTQEYALRTMIYLDIENETVAKKMFYVPVRCKCEVLCTD